MTKKTDSGTNEDYKGQEMQSNHGETNAERKAKSDRNGSFDAGDQPQNTGDGQRENNPGEESATAPQDELTKLQELQKEFDALNDKYLRLYSEFENYRKRTSKEKIEVLKSASDRLVRELLPVLDDFDRAMEANKDLDDIDAVKEGFELIYNKFYGVLKNEGLRPMDSLHLAFNTDHHDAITNVPAPSDDLKGKVVDVAEKGYLMDDRVIRHAKVVVGQ